MLLQHQHGDGLFIKPHANAALCHKHDALTVRLDLSFDHFWNMQADMHDAAAQPDSHAADRVLQGIAHTSLPYYGVQFHPESIGTAFGRQLLQNFHDITVEWHGHDLPPHITSTRTGIPISFAISPALVAAVFHIFMSITWHHLATLHSSNSTFVVLTVCMRHLTQCMAVTSDEPDGKDAMRDCLEFPSCVQHA